MPLTKMSRKKKYCQGESVYKIWKGPEKKFLYA